MKKLIFLLMLSLVMAACHSTKAEDAPYNRSEYQNDYAHLLRAHVFAACVSEGKPFATYSLATLNAKPTEEEPRYKVTFIHGPCEGKTVLSGDVILKTLAVGKEPLLKGTVLLRNFWNPRKAYDTVHIDRWHKGVVYSIKNIEKGIVELEFPRDKNDFMAPRENVFLHNVRYISAPETKDVRTWL